MPGGKRTENRDLAAVALAGGKTAAEAGKAAGVSERTVYNWLADPTFAARVRELRAGMVAAAAGRLADAMAAAALVLRKLLGSNSETIQLRAAHRLIDLGLKVSQVAELEARIAALEAESAARKGGRRA